MKKLISVILALALCCMLIPAVAEDVSLTGTWYISHAESNGTPLQIVDPEAITVTFAENNECTMAVPSFNLTQTGSWALDGDKVVITMPSEEDGEESSTDFQIVGEELIYDLNGNSVYLSRTPAEPMALPAVVPAESVDAFSGTWLPKAQMSTGLYGELTAEQLAGVAVVSIDGEKIHSLFDAGDGKLTEIGAYEFTFEDGVLKAEDNVLFPSKLTVSLLEDGTLQYRTIMQMTESFVMEIDYFYVREDAAAEPAA